MQSLDYDIWTNDLLVKEEQSRGYPHILKINITRWILYFFTGLITGMIAVLIDVTVEYLIALKSKFLQKCILFGQPSQLQDRSFIRDAFLNIYLYGQI